MIISPGNYENMFNRINSLPQTVKHLVVLTTIPVVYPKVSRLFAYKECALVLRIDTNLVERRFFWKPAAILELLPLLLWTVSSLIKICYRVHHD